MNTKSLLTSKTVAVQLIVAIAAVHPVTRDFAANHITEVGVVIAALNVLLRLITKDKVALF